MSGWLHRRAQHYVERRNGENNHDFRSNGELRLLRAVAGRCDTVFDIGANVGEWSALLLGLNPAAVVHCFEPSPITFRRLEEALGGRENVVLNNVGLSDAGGSAELFVFDDGAGINSLYRREGLESLGLSTPERSETIALVTVEGYCRERGVEAVDYVKLDVEGHELSVLKGMGTMLDDGAFSLIQFEYGGCNIDARVLLKDVFAFMAGRPYVFMKVLPKTLRRVDRYDQRLENFHYQNWVLVREDMPFGALE